MTSYNAMVTTGQLKLLELSSISSYVNLVTMALTVLRLTGGDGLNRVKDTYAFLNRLCCILKVYHRKMLETFKFILKNSRKIE